MAGTGGYSKAGGSAWGRLAGSVSGRPKNAQACGCLDCQRGTGSAFSYSAFFAEDAVRTSGEVRSYRRSSEAGRWQEMDFCPVCGVCVFCRLEVLPGIIGVSVGCFADPGFEQPEKLFC